MAGRARRSQGSRPKGWASLPQGQPAGAWSGRAGQTPIPERKPSRSRRAPPYLATTFVPLGSPDLHDDHLAFVLAAGEEGLDEITVDPSPAGQDRSPSRCTAARTDPGHCSLRLPACSTAPPRPRHLPGSPVCPLPAPTTRPRRGRAAGVTNVSWPPVSSSCPASALSVQSRSAGHTVPPGWVLEAEAVLLRLVHSPVCRVDWRRAG